MGKGEKGVDVREEWDIHHDDDDGGSWGQRGGSWDARSDRLGGKKRPETEAVPERKDVEKEKIRMARFVDGSTL